MKRMKIILGMALLGISIAMVAARPRRNSVGEELKQQLIFSFDAKHELPSDFFTRLEQYTNNDPYKIVLFFLTSDEAQWNILHHYVSHENIKGINVLLDYVNNLYRKNPTQKLKNEIFKLVNIRDMDGRSILHHALLRRNYNLSKMIINLFEDMFADDPTKLKEFFITPDNFGWNVLHVSTNNDDYKNTKLLIKRLHKLLTPQQFKTFINASDNEGDRPYDYAKPLGRTLLREHGAEVTEPSERRA